MSSGAGRAPWGAVSRAPRTRIVPWPTGPAAAAASMALIAARISPRAAVVALSACRSTLEAQLRELLAGPSPANRIHGAIELDRGGRDVPRPSQVSIEAARRDILAGLWAL
jgi:hypothetical protein